MSYQDRKVYPYVVGEQTKTAEPEQPVSSRTESSNDVMRMAQDLDAILDLARKHNLGDVSAITTGGVPRFTTTAGLARINGWAQAGIVAQNKEYERWERRNKKGTTPKS